MDSNVRNGSNRTSVMAVPSVETLLDIPRSLSLASSGEATEKKRKKHANCDRRAFSWQCGRECAREAARTLCVSAVAAAT
jgi:hypothetical protein